MIYPLMPQFLICVLGGNRFHLGVIEGVADSVASLLKLGSGAWSDRVAGRKWLVVSGYALAAVARPVAGVVAAPWQLFAARAADRVGKGIRTSPRDAMIADSTEPALRGRAFGFHRAMDHLGAAIGPLVALAFLLAWPGRLRVLFSLTLIPGLIVVALLAAGLREKAAVRRSGKPLRLTLEPFGWNFRLYLVSIVLFALGNSSDAFLLVRAGELGVPTAMLPLLWCMLHVVKSGGNLLAGRAVDRLGARPLLFFGWIVYAGIYAGFGLARSAWQIWMIFVAYGLFFALAEPAEKTLVTHLVGAERQGLAFGWFHFATGVAALPSSLIFGWLYEQFGPLTAFGWGAALAVMASLVLLCGRNPARRP
jgi:MFS family permease